MDKETREATQQFAQAEAARAAEELGVTNSQSNEAPSQEAQQPEGESPSSATPAQPAQAETPAAVTPAQAAQEAPLPQESSDDEELDIPTFQYPQPGQVFQPQPQTQPQQQEQPQQPQPQAQQPQTQPVPNLDPSQFTDQYGNVDMAKFTQAMQQRDAQLVSSVSGAVMQQVMQNVVPQVTQLTGQQVVAAKREERAWEQVFKKYPEVQENKEMRDLVHQTRLGMYQSSGKEVSPIKVAERLFKHLGKARAEGEKQASESVRIQASAHLETADNTASDKGLEQRANYQNIDARDRKVSTQARESVLKDMLARGVI